MSADGTWNITLKTPMGDREGTLTVKTAGDTFTGDVVTAIGGAPCENGKVDGSTLTWIFNLSRPMKITVECRATVDGDAISGEAKLGQMGTAQISGSRV